MMCVLRLSTVLQCLSYTQHNTKIAASVNADMASVKAALHLSKNVSDTKGALRVTAHVGENAQPGLGVSLGNMSGALIGKRCP